MLEEGLQTLSGTLHINMLRKLYNYLYHDINHNSEKQWIRKINNPVQKKGR